MPALEITSDKTSIKTNPESPPASSESLHTFTPKHQPSAELNRLAGQAVGPVDQVRNGARLSTAGEAQTELWKETEHMRAPGLTLLFIYTPV